MADPTKAATGAIPAKRAKAAIVMVCGEADALWPSCLMTRAVKPRLNAAKYRHPITVLAYPDAGHATFGPPPDPASQSAGTAAPLGGTVAGNRTARVDGWPKVLVALDAALTPGAGR